MKTNNFDLNTAYVAQKKLISRLNQDKTVIVMKTDSAEMFYKMNGLSAVIWNLFTSPVKPADILAALITRFNDQDNTLLTAEFNSLMTQLQAGDFVMPTTEAISNTKTSEIAAAFAAVTEFAMGKMTEYNLAQIETEVLNESIYLDVFAGSDLRLKKDVTPLQNPLEKILALDGISYLWNEPTAPTSVQTGLVAQQVASVLPDLVKRDTATGMLAINYTKITPYLVESIKQLKSLIDMQNERISQLENDLKKTKH